MPITNVLRIDNLLNAIYNGILMYLRLMIEHIVANVFKLENSSPSLYLARVSEWDDIFNSLLFDRFSRYLGIKGNIVSNKALNSDYTISMTAPD